MSERCKLCGNYIADDVPVEERDARFECVCGKRATLATLDMRDYHGLSEKY